MKRIKKTAVLLVLILTLCMSIFNVGSGQKADTAASPDATAATAPAPAPAPGPILPEASPASDPSASPSDVDTFVAPSELPSEADPAASPSIPAQPAAIYNSQDIVGLQAPHEKNFMFDTTRVMAGIEEETKLYFEQPNYWNTQYVYAAIQFNVSDIVTEKVPAFLTFKLNDEPIYSIKVHYINGENQIAYIKLPVNKLIKGFNSFTVEAYIRIYEQFEGCSDEFASANWVNIDKNSFICAGYDIKDPQQSISYFPYPYITTVNPNGDGTAVLIPDNYQDSEMGAALYLMADFSAKVGKENHILFGKYSTANPQNAKYKVVVATVSNMPAVYKPYVTGDLSGRAMVRYIVDNGNPTLLVTAESGDNLMEAVHMLLDDERVSQEKGDTAYIRAGSAATVAESKKLSQLVADNYTLKDITGGGLKYEGPFHKEETVYMPFENDFILSSAGKITLNFRYSENLNFDRSMITVYWGNVPLASKKLTKEKASNDQLIVTVPVDVVGSTDKSLTVAFDLEIQDLICTLRKDNMPWAYVAEDSTLYLPSQTNSYPSFEYIPSPYQSKGRFSDVLVVVPDNATAAELNIFGKAAALYGIGVGPYGSLRAIKASEFTEKDADYNIITAGTYNDNIYLRKINDILHFKYDSSGESFQSNSKLVLSDDFSQQIASMQLLQSPYAADRTILALCATDKNTTRQMELFLSKKAKTSLLKGDCALVDKDLKVRNFQFKENLDVEAKPNLIDFVAENKTSALFVLLAASALLMLLTASIIILTRAKRHSSRK